MNHKIDNQQNLEVVSAQEGSKKSRNWLGWAIAIGILVACLFFLDIETMTNSLRNLGPFEIAMILFLYSLDRIMMAFKWRLLLRVTGVSLSLWQIIKIYYQGSFSGTFMPSHVGGDLLRAYWVSKSSGIKHPVFASLVMERMIGMLSAINWALLGGMIYLCVTHPDHWWAWSSITIWAFLLGNSLFVLIINHRFHNVILNKINRMGGLKIGKLLHKFYEAYADFSNHKTVLLQNIFLTMIEHLLQMATIIYIAYSIGIDALTVIFFAATAIFLFLFRIPIAPDGWGVGELVAIALFVPIGVQAEAAFAMTFTGHILVTVALVPGFFFLLLGNSGIRPKELQD